MRLKFIGMIMTVITMLVIIGYYGNSTLESLISTIRQESQPNKSLGITKDIIYDLQIAESSLDTYILSKNADDLHYYYETVSNIDIQIDELQEYYSDNAEYQQIVGEFSKLIEEKYLIMNRFVEIKYDKSTEDVINRVLDDYEYLIQERDSVLSHDDRQSNNKASSEIFKKLIVRLLERINIKQDTLESDLSKIDDEPSVADIIIQIKEGQKVQKSQLAIAELDLLEKDRLLKQSINGLVIQLEAFENRQSSSRAQEAESMYMKAEFIIFFVFILFLVIFGVLILIIANDMKRLKLRKVQLEKEKRKALKLARVKSEFLSRMSHELRSPLNSIVGFAEQLDKNLTLQENRDLIEPVVFASKHLNIIVNDILDLSKIEAGKLKFEKTGFSPYKEISQTVKLLKPSVKNGVDLSFNVNFDRNLWLIGDPVRYRQVLINLLSNAIKFTKQGKIKVKADFSKNKLATTISDTGIGIDNDKHKLIFENFSQENADTTRKYGGTGLGLSISKRIVELQGGQINVESEKGKGSSFTFDIRYTVGENEIDEIADVKPLFSGRKAVIIDDEEFNRRLLYVILTAMNIDVKYWKNIDEAILGISTFQPDIVFMDINMPEMSGHQLIKKLIDDGVLDKNVPVIAATGGVSDDEINEIQDSGFSNHLAKPFNQLQVEHILNQYFEQTGIKNLGKPQSDPIIDEGIKYLYEISGENSDFVCEMLTMLKDNFRKDPEQILKFFKVEQYDLVAQRAHSLASSAKHLKIDNVYKLIKYIENLSKKDQPMDKEELESSIKALLIFSRSIVSNLDKEILSLKENV